ncbi:MAG: hypothetical protein ABI317_00765 [Gaiellales bacterium]
MPDNGASERELRDEIARLDAELVVFGRMPAPSEQARADLEARRARRDELAAALAQLRE